MSELGSFLRKNRESQHLTIDQIQEMTKIRKIYLQAIEAGEFEKLPGPFYVRAFTKSYAETLGLDFKVIQSTYSGELVSFDPEEDNEPINTMRRGKIANVDRIMKFGSSLLLIGFVILMFVLVYLLIIQFNNKDEKILDQTRITNEAKVYASPSPSVKEPIESVTPSESPTDEIAAEKGEVTLVGKETNTLIYNVSKVDKIDIEMQFSEDCWTLFRNQNSNGDVIKGTLNKSTYSSGDKEIVQATNSIHLRFGNAKAVILKVNGIVIEEDTLQEDGAKNVQINLVKETSEESNLE